MSSFFAGNARIRILLINNIGAIFASKNNYLEDPVATPPFNPLYFRSAGGQYIGYNVVAPFNSRDIMYSPDGATFVNLELPNGMSGNALNHYGVAVDHHHGISGELRRTFETIVWNGIKFYRLVEGENGPTPTEIIDLPERHRVVYLCLNNRDSSFYVVVGDLWVNDIRTYKLYHGFGYQGIVPIEPPYIDDHGTIHISGADGSEFGELVLPTYAAIAGNPDITPVHNFAPLEWLDPDNYNYDHGPSAMTVLGKPSTE